MMKILKIQAPPVPEYLRQSIHFYISQIPIYKASSNFIHYSVILYYVYRISHGNRFSGSLLQFCDAGSRKRMTCSILGTVTHFPSHKNKYRNK